MSVRIALGGRHREAAERIVARLIDDRVASRIAAQDPSLPVAADGGLRWTESAADARALLPALHGLRHSAGRVTVEHASGAVLGAAMLARTAGGAIVLGAAAEPVVPAPPAGADPADGPADVLRWASLAPAALAGADVAEVVAEAETEGVNLAVDDDVNNGLLLGAALALLGEGGPVAIVADGTHIVGFPAWASAVVAASGGSLAVDPDAGSGDASGSAVRLVADAHEQDPGDDVLVSGTLGELVLVWLTAVAVAAAVALGPDA